jgi:hypothetical protein
MAEIRLVDVVLLRCNFDALVSTGESAEPDRNTSMDEEALAGADLPYEYPAGDFLVLEAWMTEQPDAVALFVTAKLEDAALPFRLEATMGARFTIDDMGDASSENIERTLTWLCYPYIRELISTVTGRSPLPPYFLPAITKMPHPTVEGSTPPPTPDE